MVWLSHKSSKRKQVTGGPSDFSGGGGFGLEAPPDLSSMKNDQSHGCDSDDDKIKSSCAVASSCSSSSTNRMAYLDSLRGILSVLVVFHHFRCGFFPCHMFAGSAEWMTDPSICDDNNNNNKTDWTTTLMRIFVNPFVNGTFCVAVFFVMSGVVLSHGLWHVNQDKWRVKVVKRFFRLALPCAAALLWSSLLGGLSTTVHEDAAALTKSIWLARFNPTNPDTFTGLMSQVGGWGVFHGSSTLNNAIWSMPIELFGSYLVFLVVAVLNASSYKIRRRWLMVLFVALIVPSKTRKPGMSYHVHYTVSAKSKTPDRKDATNRTIALNPYLLSRFGAIANGGIGATSVVPLSLHAEAPDDRQFDRAGYDDNMIALDNPKTHRTNLTNSDLIVELSNVFDPSNKLYQLQDVEFVRLTTWMTVNPWLWYATFVAGIAISDYAMQLQNSRGGGSAAALPRSSSSQLRHHLLAVLALVCASFPYCPGLEAFFLWDAMAQIAADLFGLGGRQALIFWYVIGASALVQYIVGCSRACRDALVSHPVLSLLGRLSFALYLTHIPILYTITSWLFLQLDLRFYDNPLLAKLLALLLSLPIMFAVAYLFMKYVDQPAIRCSHKLGHALLGISPGSGRSITGESQNNNNADDFEKNKAGLAKAAV